MQHTPRTHHEWIKTVSHLLVRRCQRADMTFGDRCLNCGFDGERELHLARLSEPEYKKAFDKLQSLYERLLT